MEPRNPNKSPVAATYNDGTYTAVSDADHHGYGLATVTISADKITKVDLKEFIETGAEKDFDTYKYKPSVQANQEMAQRIVKANSIHVDDYTKATSSSTKYKQAVARALDKAKTKPAVTTEYFDGVFLGKSGRRPWLRAGTCYHGKRSGEGSSPARSHRNR